MATGCAHAIRVRGGAGAPPSETRADFRRAALLRGRGNDPYPYDGAGDTRMPSVCAAVQEHRPKCALIFGGLRFCAAAATIHIHTTAPATPACHPCVRRCRSTALRERVPEPWFVTDGGYRAARSRTG